ncbi:ATP-dependent sacrificial sulfur transferase LarE [Candidatus Bathyarchaeota archaeon]|nr:MAG: ATP-dependent sacrificial sulfur transferase LarE [Candidatus Bathyarchaeota archaeon]
MCRHLPLNLEESLPPGLQQKFDAAISQIRLSKGAVVALSAGVDSSLVALLAHKALGDHAVAVTGVSESLPPHELEIAKETAKAIGIKHLVVQTDELQNPEYTSNRADRCYHCKDTLYRELRSLADGLGLEAILDGTQIDDLSDDRPGFIAAQEAGVKSPLLIASFSKADVRETARLLGLSIWDKPAMPCLSSRITHGEEVTANKLGMIGQAELRIKELTGVRNLRVRYSNSSARIQVAPEERKLFFDEAVMDQVDRTLKQLGFMTVTLDLKGYVRKERTPAAGPLLLPMASLSK